MIRVWFLAVVLLSSACLRPCWSRAASLSGGEPQPTPPASASAAAPAEEKLGEVPEPATWAAGSGALALTVYLLLRRARAWDERQARPRG